MREKEVKKKTPEEKAKAKKVDTKWGWVGLIIIVIAVIVAVNISLDSPEEGVEVERKEGDVEVEQEKGYFVGQTLGGISFKEIIDKWGEECDKSSLKGDEYLESLAGQKIVWVGEVAEVEGYTDGSGYVKVKLYDEVVFDYYTYIDFKRGSEYRDLNKGDLVKISGTIQSFNKEHPFELTLCPDLINPVIEVINQ
jgi:hypothetical protein